MVTKESTPAPRFGIAEWYGFSFLKLSAGERKAFATFKPNKKDRLNKTERMRLRALEAKESAGALAVKELTRLGQLREKLRRALDSNKRCPFKTESDALCTKDGGVCSLRLYESDGSAVSPVMGARGEVRALCPARFHQDGDVFKWVAEEILGDRSPNLAGEVGFLESSETVDSKEGEDVGRIDMVLVSSKTVTGAPMEWCALEIQAVYFSGKEMGAEFRAIAEDNGDGMVFPKESRRPDYRSSGPKRLMPQLQIKVPTLRRWGKKMAVVVDRAFFDSIGEMDHVSEVSNSDIAWFVVRFAEVDGGRSIRMVRDIVRFTTLERSVEGLTGGKPVPLPVFEHRITRKVGAPLSEEAEETVRQSLCHPRREASSD